MSALRGWRAAFARLTDAQQRAVREILAENYATEIRHARGLAEHPDALGRYPDRRKRLLGDHPDIARLLERISEEEAAHQRQLVWLLARSTDRVALDRST
jgi:DNA-binding MarR family transcriptional regulator